MYFPESSMNIAGSMKFCAARRWLLFYGKLNDFFVETLNFDSTLNVWWIMIVFTSNHSIIHQRNSTPHKSPYGSHNSLTYIFPGRSFCAATVICCFNFNVKVFHALYYTFCNICIVQHFYGFGFVFHFSKIHR